MAKNFGSGVVGGVVLIDPATGQPYKATGGGGGGVSSWNDLEDKPAVIAAGATAEAARAALGLADVAASGSYNDLTDRPTTPDATTTAKGAVELATNTETTTGTDTARATTPAGVKAALDARAGDYATAAQGGKADSAAQPGDITAAINSLVASAPGTLDTLAELATALGNDPNFATTITALLAARVRVDIDNQGLTGTQQANARANIGALPVTPAAHVGAEYSIAYTDAVGLGTRPTLPAGATLRIYGGTVSDADPAWMATGDYRDIPVA